MITSFKIFENDEEKYRWLESVNKYWKVYLNDNLVELRLYKTGMDKVDLEHWLEISQDFFKRKGYKYIYIGLDDNYDWSYAPEEKVHHYTNKGFGYMGEVELTDEEIEEYKLKNNIKNYNI